MAGSTSHSSHCPPLAVLLSDRIKSACPPPLPGTAERVQQANHARGSGGGGGSSVPSTLPYLNPRRPPTVTPANSPARTPLLTTSAAAGAPFSRPARHAPAPPPLPLTALSVLQAAAPGPSAGCRARCGCRAGSGRRPARTRRWRRRRQQTNSGSRPSAVERSSQRSSADRCAHALTSACVSNVKKGDSHVVCVSKQQPLCCRMHHR